VNEEKGNEVNSKTGHGNFKVYNPCAPFPLYIHKLGMRLECRGCSLLHHQYEIVLAVLLSYSFPDTYSCGILSTILGALFSANTDV